MDFYKVSKEDDDHLLLNVFNIEKFNIENFGMG